MEKVPPIFKNCSTGILEQGMFTLKVLSQEIFMLFYDFKNYSKSVLFVQALIVLKFCVDY